MFNSFQQKEDEEELLVYKINNEEFTLPRKYSKFLKFLFLELLGVLGQGSYGTVLRGQDSSKTDLAIKKNRNVFPHKNTNFGTNQELIQMRILRELKVLIHLEHDNVMKI